MSAVREAILAAIDKSDSDLHGTVEGWDALVEALVEAVERVPVVVTIRDLDMADGENIVTVRNMVDLEYLHRLFAGAVNEGSASVTVDGGFLKVKAGEFGSWSAPIATEVYRS